MSKAEEAHIAELLLQYQRESPGEAGGDAAAGGPLRAAQPAPTLRRAAAQPWRKPRHTRLRPAHVLLPPGTSSGAQGPGKDAEDAGDDASQMSWAGEEYEAGSVRGVQPSYLKFSKRLRQHPDQCVRCVRGHPTRSQNSTALAAAAARVHAALRALAWQPSWGLTWACAARACPARYCRGGQPLWPLPQDPSPVAGGLCTRCQGPRTFELQLMAPIISMIMEAGEVLSQGEGAAAPSTAAGHPQQQAADLDAVNGAANWDLCTLAVYTCTRACTAARREQGAGASFDEEHVVLANEDECHLT